MSPNCDGCLNINNPDNAGLAPVITALDSVYNGNHNSAMSRADFWVLASIVAVEDAVCKANEGPCDPEEYV